MTDLSKQREVSREIVLHSYKTALYMNKERFMNGDQHATSEYIYPNQMFDALMVVNKFYHDKRRVISVQKKTKVGADGLMIEIAKLMATHPDDSFVVNSRDVRIITGMSNKSWENDMIEKSPSCFQKKIHHHGQLFKSDLNSMKNGLL